MKLKEFHEYHHQKTLENDDASTPQTRIEFATTADEEVDIPPGAELFIDLAYAKLEQVEKAVGAEAKLDALANMMALLMVAQNAANAS